jgi:CxxC-x17-CxxC domain-containing protein
MSDDQTVVKPAAASKAQAASEPQSAGTDKYGRQLYKVVCAKCGGEAIVPFKPSSDRPVYCRNCYQPKPRRDFGGGGRSSGGRGFGPRDH